MVGVVVLVLVLVVMVVVAVMVVMVLVMVLMVAMVVVSFLGHCQPPHHEPRPREALRVASASAGSRAREGTCGDETQTK